jgi:hypothetical protein
LHDAELVRATSEINTILAKAEAAREEGRNLAFVVVAISPFLVKDRSRNLSFIVVEGSPFLIWTEPGAVGPDDDAETVAGALGLRS